MSGVIVYEYVFSTHFVSISAVVLELVDPVKRLFLFDWKIGSKILYFDIKLSLSN